MKNEENKNINLFFSCDQDEGRRKKEKKKKKKNYPERSDKKLLKHSEAEKARSRVSLFQS